MAGHYQQEPGVLRKILEGQNQLGFIRESLMQQKTIEFIADKAVMVEDLKQEDTNLADGE